MPNAGRHPINYHSSRCIKSYHFVRSFESHHVDGVGSHSNKEDTHNVEVNRSPVHLQYHVGISSEKHHKVQLLRLVAEANNVLIGKDLEQ